MELELKKLDLRPYNKEELELVKSRTKAFYNKVIKELADYEDKKTVRGEIERIYLLILKRCK